MNYYLLRFKEFQKVEERIMNENINLTEWKAILQLIGEEYNYLIKLKINSIKTGLKHCKSRLWKIRVGNSYRFKLTLTLIIM